MVGGLLHHAGQLLHARRRFLQRRSLLFGALRQIGIARGDLLRGAGDRIRPGAHLADHALQTVLHPLQGLQQATGLIGAIDVDRMRQVAPGDVFRLLDRTVQRDRDRAAQGPGQQPPAHDAAQQQHGGQRAQAIVLALAGLVAGAGDLHLHARQRSHLVAQRTVQGRHRVHHGLAGAPGIAGLDGLHQRLGAVAQENAAQRVGFIRQLVFIGGRRQGAVALPGRIGPGEKHPGALEGLVHARGRQAHGRAVEHDAEAQQVGIGIGQCHGARQLHRIGVLHTRIGVAHADQTGRPHDDSERTDAHHHQRQTEPDGHTAEHDYPL